jgi:hypothetical protein
MRASFFTLLAITLAALPMQTRALSVLSATALDPENAEIIDYSPVDNTVVSTISAVATGGFGVKIYTIDAAGALTERSVIAWDTEFGTVADMFGTTSTALDPLGRGFGAVAFIPVANTTVKGKVAFYDFRSATATAAQKLKVLDVGFHPDSIKFTPDGTKLIVANEGEIKAATLATTAAVASSALVPVANTASLLPGMNAFGSGIPSGTTIVTIDSATQITLSNTVTLASAAEFNVQLPTNLDAPGSISIIDLTGVTGPASISAPTFTQARVTEFDFQAANLASGVTINDVRYNEIGLPSADFYRFIEPEYVAPMNDKVYVTLQENNAIAEFTYSTSKWTRITPLGTITQLIDASDRDNATLNGPKAEIDELVAGLPMPDAIVAYEVAGQRYLVTVNEGDARPDDADINRVGSTGTVAANKKGLPMDSTVLASGINVNNRLARLNISLVDGDTDNDGDIDVPTMIGTRSFTIWDADSGALVWDSGSLETLLLSLAPQFHNINSGLLSNFDTRSDDKGPEPEALAIGTYGSAIYAFVGLERQNGILVFNITDPTEPFYVGYNNSLDRGIISPESIAFIPASTSPNQMPMFVAGFEGTGTAGNGLVVHDIFARHDLQIYKLAAARNWQQDELYYPNSSAPVRRNPQAGVVRDTAYLIVDRTAQEVRTINYYTRVFDGAKIKEYTISTDDYVPWTESLPAGGEMEFLQTAAPGVGIMTSSFKQGRTVVANNDVSLDDDMIFDTGVSSDLFYLIGSGKDIAFGKRPNTITLPKVPTRMTGVARQVLDATLGDNMDPVRQVFYRSTGTQTATLDTVLTTKVITLLPAATGGLSLSDMAQATTEVEAALSKLGFDPATPIPPP